MADNSADLCELQAFSLIHVRTRTFPLSDKKILRRTSLIVIGKSKTTVVCVDNCIQHHQQKSANVHPVSAISVHF